MSPEDQGLLERVKGGGEGATHSHEPMMLRHSPRWLRNSLQDIRRQPCMERQLESMKDKDKQL